MRQRVEGSKHSFGGSARVLAALGLAGLLLLSGCHDFFVCQKASCPSSGSGSTGTTGSGDYAYVSNSASGSTYVAEYDLSGGALTAISGSPYNLGFIPVAMSVAPSNSYLYAATPVGVTNPGIYDYTIGSTGALTAANGGTVLVTDAVSSMDISPDGNYLFALETSGETLNEYSVNTSTGALQLANSFQLPISTGTTCTLQTGTPVTQGCTVKVAPSGDYVIAALGTTGVAIFPYSSSSGITSVDYTLISTGSTISGDYSVAMDNSDHAYIASTNGLAVYSVAPGSATQVSTASYTSGDVPRSVVLSNGYDYVYTANEGASSISGYSISSGVLTAINGSAFTGPTDVSAIGVDSTGDYLIAAGFNGSSGVQLYTIGSSGALTSVASAGSGTVTTNPAVLALTH